MMNTLNEMYRNVTLIWFVFLLLANGHGQQCGLALSTVHAGWRPTDFIHRYFWFPLHCCCCVCEKWNFHDQIKWSSINRYSAGWMDWPTYIVYLRLICGPVSICAVCTNAYTIVPQYELNSINVFEHTKHVHCSSRLRFWLQLKTHFPYTENTHWLRGGLGCKMHQDVISISIHMYRACSVFVCVCSMFMLARCGSCCARRAENGAIIVYIHTLHTFSNAFENKSAIN